MNLRASRIDYPKISLVRYEATETAKSYLLHLSVRVAHAVGRIAAATNYLKT